MLGLVACAAVPAAGQAVQTSKGVVEFLGLEQWTPDAIRERLGYSSPDEFHYCAADLKKAGFADAVVFADAGYKAVIVIEPHRRADVSYRPRPADPIEIPTGWRPLRPLVAAKPPAFLFGEFLDYAGSLPGARAAEPFVDRAGPTPAWWSMLRALSSPADYSSALEILARAAEPADRALAAMVLVNFPARDGAWHGLAAALRDSDQTVGTAAAQGLNSLGRYRPRRVDWSAAEEDLRAVLRGTNVYALPVLLNVLTVTQVDRSLAPSVLAHGNARLVLACLGASRPFLRDPAHALLVHLRGADLGKGAAAWEAWVSTL